MFSVAVTQGLGFGLLRRAAPKRIVSFHGMEFFYPRAKDNKSLVQMLRSSGMIKSDKVASVMEQMDRALFVPEQSYAYADMPLPIGYGATISAPHMHGSCLELLKDHLQPGMRALDVGSGTGYLTGAFALMVGETGKAVGIEHIAELVEQSIKNIKRSKAAPFLESGSLVLRAGDGRQGCPEFAPYDAIHVGAAAAKVPQPLLDQLKPRGRMVIPVGGQMEEQYLMVFDKQEDGTIKETIVTSVRYVPLTSKEYQLCRNL